MTDEIEEVLANDLLYPHVMQAVYGSCWMITEEQMDIITAILQMRAHGERLSSSAIDERIAMAQQRQGPRNGPRKGVVGVLPVYGTIIPRGGMMSRSSGGTSVEDMKAGYEALLNDSEVTAILLDVDSPGGQVDGVFEFAKVIRDTRQSAGGPKPVVALANTLMASAAYLISSAADEIVASPSSMVGSIGVLMPHVDKTGAEEISGVKTTLITAGKYKAEGFGPLTDEARAARQSIVDEYYGMMTSDIASGRGVTASAVRSGYGEGRAILAKPALSAGLIDRIDTYDATVRRLARSGAVRSRGAGAEASGPGREAFADRLALAAEEVTTVVSHARDRAGLRAEEGRKLSDEDMDGLRQIAALGDAVTEAQMVLATQSAEPEAAAASLQIGRAVRLRVASYRSTHGITNTEE